MSYIACWGYDAWRDIRRGGDGSKGVLVSIPPSGVPWPRVRHNGEWLRSLALYEQSATGSRLDVLIEGVIWMNEPNIWATLTTTLSTWSDLHDAFSLSGVLRPTAVSAAGASGRVQNSRCLPRQRHRHTRKPSPALLCHAA